jgi:hypothetical protein
MWTFKMYSRNVKTTNEPTASNNKSDRPQVTGTCFIQKIYSPSASLLQGKYLPFSPSPLRLNIFRLFVILSLTQLYRYTPEIFLFSTATFKYTPLRRIGQEYSANVTWSTFQSFKRIQPLPVCAGFFIWIRHSLDRPCNNVIMIISSQM